MNKKILSLVFVLVSQLVHAQQKQIDSVMRLYNTTTVDTLKIQYAYYLGRAITEPAAAARYIEAGERLAEKIQNRYYISFGKLCWAAIYSDQGNYPLSIKNNLEGLKIALEIGNAYLVMGAYDDLGNTYDDEKDEQKAIYYTKQSIVWIRKMKDTSLLVDGYSHLSNYYDKLGQPRQALVYNQIANELASRTHNDFIKGRAYIGIGHTYLLLKQPETGLPYLHNALALLKMQDILSATYAYRFLSDYYTIAGPRDSAIKYTTKQLEVCKILPYADGVLDAAGKLAKQYESYDQQKAISYYKTALKLNQQLFDSEKTRAFQNVVTADEQERREQAEKQREAEQERKENLQLIAIAIFIPIFILLIFRLRRTKLHRRVIDFLGVLSLLLVFEFITLLIHPFIERSTGHRPIFELMILVGLASLLVPAHHELTHWLKARLAVPHVAKPKEQEK